MARLCGAATTVRGTSRRPWSPARDLVRERAAAAAHSCLGDASWAAAWSAGCALSREEAIIAAMAVSVGSAVADSIPSDNP
jgi:hypothetical protein